jgi:hypothetical protein
VIDQSRNPGATLAPGAKVKLTVVAAG